MSSAPPNVSCAGWGRWTAEAVAGMPGQKVKAQFLLLNPLCSPLSKQNCSRNEIQKLFHSRNESCRKGFPSFQFFPKLNPRKQTVRGWVGSREELCVCLPEHSVLSFWHCMFSPGLDVATGWEVDLQCHCEMIRGLKDRRVPGSSGWDLHCWGSCCGSAAILPACFVCRGFFRL